MARVRGLWLRFWSGVSSEGILLDWTDVFPSSAVSPVFGFNVIAVCY